MIRAIATIVLIFLTIQSPAMAENHEQRVIKMANDSIFWALVVAKSRSGKLACFNTPLACSDDRGELGLALLAMNNSNASLASLIEIMRFNIDASLSEDFDCYVINKGKRVLAYLEKIKPINLVKQCNDSIFRAQLSNSILMVGISSADICSTIETIAKKRDSMISMITLGKRCSNEHF